MILNWVLGKKQTNKAVKFKEIVTKSSNHPYELLLATNLDKLLLYSLTDTDTIVQYLLSVLKTNLTDASSGLWPLESVPFRCRYLGTVQLADVSIGRCSN